MASPNRSTVRIAVALSLAAGAGGLAWVIGEGIGLHIPTGITGLRTTPSRPGDLLHIRAPARPDAQVAQVRAHEAGPSLRRALAELLALSATERAALAVQNAASLSDDEGQIEALHESLPRWFSQDAQAARAWLRGHVATLAPAVAVSLLRDTAALDPELALSLTEQLSPAARRDALREIFRTWAEAAPEQAARAAAELREGDDQAGAIGEVARAWAEHAPAEAEAWASALPTEQARREALVPIVDNWATQDAKQAALALAKLPDEAYKQRLVDMVAAEWVRESPIAARTWVETLAPALREGALAALLASLLQSDAQQAANWALELGGAPASTLVETTVTSWVTRDPGAALAWLIKLPDRRGRTELLVLATERFRLSSGPGRGSWIGLRFSVAARSVAAWSSLVAEHDRDLSRLPAPLRRAEHRDRSQGSATAARWVAAAAATDQVPDWGWDHRVLARESGPETGQAEAPWDWSTGAAKES